MARPGDRLGAHCQIDLVANSREEIQLNFDVVLARPIVYHLAHGVVPRRHPVVPEGATELAGRLGAADVNQRQRRRG